LGQIKLLFTGDWHIRGNNPRNRIDDYKAAVFKKLREVFHIAEDGQVLGIIMPGDVFDGIEVSIRLLLEVARLLNESPVTIYATLGNHDMEGYNTESWNRSSLKLLTLICPKLVVCWALEAPQFFDAPEAMKDVAVTFTPYSGRMDVDGYGYSPAVVCPKSIRIHVAHGMLLDHDPPFDRYTNIKTVKTEAHIVLTGHDHVGYGIFRRADGVIFCNPGSLTRKEASISEMNRTVQLALVTVWGDQYDVKLIPLNSARPSEEVLDRTSIEAVKLRSYSMDNFTATMRDAMGNRVAVNVESIIELISIQYEIEPEVVTLALEQIAKQRESGK
jgi:exonuclease SbcD